MVRERDKSHSLAAQVQSAQHKNVILINPRNQMEDLIVSRSVYPGVFGGDEKRHPDFEAEIGSPGMARMLKNL